MLIPLTLRDSKKQTFGQVLTLGFLPLGQGCGQVKDGQQLNRISSDLMADVAEEDSDSEDEEVLAREEMWKQGT